MIWLGGILGNGSTDRASGRLVSRAGGEAFAEGVLQPVLLQLGKRLEAVVALQGRFIAVLQPFADELSERFRPLLFRQELDKGDAFRIEGVDRARFGIIVHLNKLTDLEQLPVAIKAR